MKHARSVRNSAESAVLAAGCASVCLAICLSACAPVADGANIDGDETECTATITCQGGPCGGTNYRFDCVFNSNNQVYECTCSADGAAGETFSEAEMCETDNSGNFAHLDAADAIAHAIEDCKFPLANGAPEG